jgi:hypothetical protein
VVGLDQAVPISLYVSLETVKVAQSKVRALSELAGAISCPSTASGVHAGHQQIPLHELDASCQLDLLSCSIYSATVRCLRLSSCSCCTTVI